MHRTFYVRQIFPHFSFYVLAFWITAMYSGSRKGATYMDMKKIIGFLILRGLAWINKKQRNRREKVDL